MNLKNKIAALSAILMLQNFGAVNAAAIDDELAVFAAEQDKTGEKVETFDPDSVDGNKDKPKTKKEIEAEEKRLEKEREEARQKIKDERKKSRDELKGKTPISKNPAPPVRENNSPIIQRPIENPTVKEVPTVKPVEEIKPVTTPNKVNPVETPQTVQLPNPVTTYANFNEIVQALGFTPLYIPKKFGYDITAIMTIDTRIAEIRYNRKWEPNVSLHVRTYRRAVDEELQDISGVHGVKWRVVVVNGITVYIAKINETKSVAAWAVGNYTFSAYVENLSFAAFHSAISDELVDLSQHYYLGN